MAWGRSSTIVSNTNDTEANESIEAVVQPPEKNDFIVTGSLDDTVKVWNLNGKKLELRQQLSGHSLGVVSVAVSNDGSKIASSSLDSGLCIWNAETGQLLNQTALGPVDLWTVTFSPDGKHVVSGSHEGKISLYSVESAKPEVILDPQNGKFTLSIAYVSRIENYGKVLFFIICFLNVFRVLMASILPVAPLTE